MHLESDSNKKKSEVGGSIYPDYNTTWDRDLNVYNISEIPILPSEVDDGDIDLPIGLYILREFCVDAANAFAWEIWFDFEPHDAEGSIDACWSPPGKGTQIVRLPKSLLFDGRDELGIFSILFDKAAEDGIFAIHQSEFRDAPKKHNPWDKKGRLVPPPPEPDPPDEVPGMVETVTIRAFRLSLKGHSAPQDFVIQICPRFWHMPTGFEVG
ncbi:MAG TPA: hypothetical protein ENN67_02440 [Firmicutes bacterium]|nr:hypothetical protein [Bacillota bacterium]